MTVRRPLLRSILVGLIPFAAMCFSVALWDRVEPMIFGLPLNFANIIVLPLLFGIGVAFHIYFIMAWREGTREFLQTSLTRAIFLSALTTATGFGTLWLSSHPGTSSMGELLMISLCWTLITLFVLPTVLEAARGK